MAIDALSTEVFRTFAFDGETAASFGVQVLGEGVFNAPEKSVEFVSIPGRNGDLIIDNGKYENVTVTYPATVIASTPEDFASGMAAFRNYLCSRKGYCRLEDTYNPNEYRMATYVSGLEVDEEVLRVGKFDIVFNCKPQRFLMAGESAIEVTDGQSVFNPTPFESQPLLAIEGYGTIGFNGYEIELEDTTLGDITILLNTSRSFKDVDATHTLNAAFYPNRVNDGDPITIANSAGGPYCSNQFLYDAGTYSIDEANCTYAETNIRWSILEVPRYSSYATEHYFRVRAGLDTVSLTAGTASSQSASVVVTMPMNYRADGTSTGKSVVVTIGMTFSYDGDNNITVSTTREITSDPLGATSGFDDYVGIYIPEITAVSTVDLLGHPTYIDCELGEAYMIKDGSFISLNEYIDLGSDLPTLAPGNNEFTFDDTTMTDVQLTPRWWIL